MNLVHESREWADLLAIVADRLDRDIGMVEKDYWVTHTLWAINEQGFDVWFKGGTSLSKGFGLIERFSEDIDVRMDSGSTGLTDPQLSWNNRKTGVQERDNWFDTISDHFSIPACEVCRDPAGSDDLMRSAWFEVHYPALHADSLPEDMRPFVLLEVGRARVTPFVERDLSSWVHDHLQGKRLLVEFLDNRPGGVRCIHPWVTCLEKVEAIARKFEKGKAAADFVRHYEDAAYIIRSWDDLPPLEMDLEQLVAELAREDKKRMPKSEHAAFNLDPESDRWKELQDAWQKIARMYWGPRVTLEESCGVISDFLGHLQK